MNINFSCLHTKESLFTNRIYVYLDQNQSRVKEIVFSDGKEKKGLGMTEYGNILGFLLTAIGIAFKAKDENGNTLYINKKSFCNMIQRVQKNAQQYDHFNVDFVEGEYHRVKNQVEQRRVEKICRTFNRILPFLSDKNIVEVSFALLKSYKAN